MTRLSFDAFRTLGMSGVEMIKPEHAPRLAERLRAAEWVLFPPSWLLQPLVAGLGCRVFPSPASYLVGRSKSDMTRTLQLCCPAHLPETWIGPADAAGQAEALDILGLPMVVKHPLAAEGRGVARIDSIAALADWCRATDVLYAQEVLPIERDLRVVVVGDAAPAAYWRRAPAGGFLNNVAAGGRIDWRGVPVGIVDWTLSLARRLGVDHAGFDIAVVDGHPYVIEANLLFGNTALNARGIRIPQWIDGWLRRCSARPDEPPPWVRAA